ncbi:MAG: hypothetical protein GX442_12155 [Candidatus Riflebacteria bacterium]|nr:hypothetical protein [Candidatus Riflebacteria bacterium]
MKRHLIGFSMIEVLVALVFVSFSFLPIYNLFRFGQRGAVSNEKEVEATNMASDLINFMRDRKGSDLDALYKNVRDIPEFKDDDEIAAMLKQINLTPLPKVREGFTRSMQLKRYEGKSGKTSFNPINALIDFINRRRAVPNYLVRVRVAYPMSGSAKGTTPPEDDVILYTILMD